MAETSTGRPGTLRIQQLGNAYKQAGTLWAAIELDVFTKVAGGATTLADIAQETGLAAGAADKLVTACTALGLLEKEGERYRNAPDVDRYLVKGKPGYIGVWVLFARHAADRWQDLAAVLRGDKEPASRSWYDEAWADFAFAKQLSGATHNAGLASGRRLAKVFDYSRRSLILDLGGGSGCYCIAAAQAHPHIRGIVFDYPTICRVAAGYIAEAGLSERITTQAGDLIKDDYPAGADVALLCSNLPNFSRQELALIARKAFTALVPGGVLHVIGEAVNDARTGPLEPALWYLEEVVVGNRSSELHTVAGVRDTLAGAGFVDLGDGEFVPGVLQRITGVKPK